MIQLKRIQLQSIENQLNKKLNEATVFLFQIFKDKLKLCSMQFDWYQNDEDFNPAVQKNYIIGGNRAVPS